MEESGWDYSHDYKRRWRLGFERALRNEQDCDLQHRGDVQVSLLDTLIHDWNDRSAVVPKSQPGVDVQDSWVTSGDERLVEVGTTSRSKSSA